VIAIFMLQKLRVVTVCMLIFMSQITHAQTMFTTQCQALVKHSQANKLQIEKIQLIILTMADGSAAMQLQGNSSQTFSYLQPAPKGKQTSDTKVALHKNLWNFRQEHPNSLQKLLQINPFSGALQYIQTSKYGAENVHIEGACELPIQGKEAFIQAHSLSDLK
jgi:hypothetical protein